MMINEILIGLGILPFAMLVTVSLGYSILLSFFLNKSKENSEKNISDISVIVPAYNEEEIISKKIQNTLEINFPSDFEVIVVDDGSTDNTAQIVKDSVQDEKVKLIKKGEREGKASVIMKGVKEANYDLVLLTDADAVLEKDCINYLLEKFGKNVGAVTGRMIIDNQNENFVTRAEGSLWEYADLVCRAESNLDSLPRVFGPISLIRKELVKMPKETLLDDMELGVRVRERGLKCTYAPDARAHIRVPQSLEDQTKLRSRYFKGYLQLTKRYKKLLFNPDYGFFGIITLPRHVLFEVLSPILLAIVTLSFIILGIIEGPNFINYLILVYFLMAVSLFFMGFTLFIRKRSLKESIFDSLNMVFFVISLQFYRIYSLFQRREPTWDRLKSTR